MFATLFFSSLAFAAGFSADATTTDKNGIIRLDKQVLGNIDKASKMYTEMSLRPGMAPAPSGTEKAPGEEERVLIVTETIEGRLADKYRVTQRNGRVRYAFPQYGLRRTSPRNLRSACRVSENVDAIRAVSNSFVVTAHE